MARAPASDQAAFAEIASDRADAMRDWRFSHRSHRAAYATGAPYALQRQDANRPAA